MGNRLIQYRIAEAAVLDSFIPWVQEHASDALAGSSPVVVVDHAQQIPSLKGQVLASGITLMGVEWQTAAGLRRMLCQKLNITFDPLGRENLQLLIRVAAAGMEGSLATALAVDPTEALKAMDELGRSGRKPGDWQGVLPDDFIQLGQVLEQTGEWLPELESRCLGEASDSSVKIGPVLLFGWGGDHFPDLRLVSILSHLTESLTILVPQPRLLGDEDLDEEWVLALERLLGVDSEFAQDPENWQSLHEGFVNSLVMEESAANAVLPEVLVGQAEDEQAGLVADWIERQSSLLHDTHPVACLVTGEGGSLYRLTREFLHRGIVFHQEVGEVLSAGGFHTFHKLLVRCLSTGSDIDEVLRLLEWLLAREESCVSGLEYQVLRDKCIRRFNQDQNRHFSKLWSKGKQTERLDSPEEALVKFSEWLEPWPEQVSWENARERWVQVASNFGFGADYLEPVWSRLSEHLVGKLIPSRYFFEYIESLLGAPGLWRDEHAVQPYAQVIITTQAAAVGRSWGAMVFMDSQEGGWPTHVSENPFLKDASREALNREGSPMCSRLITTRERMRIQHYMVLNVMENCAGRILFSGSLTDGRAPEVKTFPNEWAAQVLLSDNQDADLALRRWEQVTRAIVPLDVASDNETLSHFNPQHFREVHENRMNPDIPVGAYDFRFSGKTGQSFSSFHASRIDGILAAPASYAIGEILDAAPRSLSDFMRKEALLLGVWTHAALAEILNQDQDALQNQTLKHDSLMNPVLSGLWMEVLAEKASWMVRSCLRELQQLDGIWKVEQVEWSPGTINFKTSFGSIAFAGRLDLVLRSEQGEQLIIDFKTGKTGEIPTPKMLGDKGTGLQYIAYLLLTEKDGRDSRVRVINPFKSQDRELTLDYLENAQPHLDILALMASHGIFPRRGPLRDEYSFSAEVLPLTTLPINEEVLEEKWQQFISGAAAQ